MNKQNEDETVYGGDCPMCAARLVPRTNKRNGQTFWGCSNYPRCIYTERVKQELASWIKRKVKP